VRKAEGFKAKNIDTIACMAVNDAFVMECGARISRSATR
jgi:peroxiredoxin